MRPPIKEACPPSGFRPTPMIVLDNGFLPRTFDLDTRIDMKNIVPDAYWAYQNLSTSYNTGVSGYAIDVCLEYEFGFLHAKAQRLINLETTWLEGLFHASGRTMAQKHLEKLRRHARATQLGPDFFDAIRRCPYTIMPINTGNHWEAVLLCLQRDEDGKKDGYTKVRHVTVIDPARDADSAPRVEKQLRRILKPKGFTFATKRCRRDITGSHQRDSHSCGLHVYQTVKTLLHRIDVMARDGTADSGSPDDDRLWAPMDGKRFIAEKVRAKMRGIAAEVFLRDCKGKVRAVFVPTRRIVPHGSRQSVNAATILYPNSSYKTKMVETGVPLEPSIGKRKRNVNNLDEDGDNPLGLSPGTFLDKTSPQ
ncbi:hypothetical protein PFICI_13490 [Pestalotiopsis fici W106-1]|uniref:Ubiquitin-like protease family profile domain-containing protein n=1 Tax=Pestalotiopsis fici (strain W106-1 / CGMCC3.15140) TaxID=1229662 RepID=W3WQA1_PESFW|nr:uncharacterized protein PFICI_13490 [Pestalotiopsis fici W106-1]ETS75006.1 hypothetical protein PFICI_13490 [Pestalotiopsis fici W106-1]